MKNTSKNKDINENVSETTKKSADKANKKTVSPDAAKSATEEKTAKKRAAAPKESSTGSKANSDTKSKATKSNSPEPKGSQVNQPAKAAKAASKPADSAPDNAKKTDKVAKADKPQTKNDVSVTKVAPASAESTAPKRLTQTKPQEKKPEPKKEEKAKDTEKAKKASAAEDSARKPAESAKSPAPAAPSEKSEESTDTKANDGKAARQAKKKSADKPRFVDSLFDFVELFVFTLAAVLIITSFFFRYSIVDGDSMQTTLEHNERLILRSFLYEPECGDIVVVQDKSTDLKSPIVKRVIATEGQTVRFYRNCIYVDGVMLDEPYVYTDDFFSPFTDEYGYSVNPSEALTPIVTERGTDDIGDFYEIEIPENEIFVMGDHRNVSKDSREIGAIHEDAVIGKVVLRFYPFEKFGAVD